MQQLLLGASVPPAAPLAVDVAPATLAQILPSGSYTTSGQSLGSATATPTGGTPPYSYAWTRISGTFTAVRGGISTATLSLSDSSGQGRAVADGTTATETHRCTVTDSASATVTDDVVLDILFSGAGGSG